MEITERDIKGSRDTRSLSGFSHFPLQEEIPVGLEDFKLLCCSVAQKGVKIALKLHLLPHYCKTGNTNTHADFHTTLL